jgi:hypothetical protein
MALRAKLEEMQWDFAGLPIEERNVRSMVLGTISRLVRFLEITLHEYEEAAESFKQNVARQLELAAEFGEGEHTLTPEEVTLSEQGARLTLVLHLKIETFYVFAKILLDKTGQTIEHYHGPGRAASLERHSKLLANLETYIEQKQLEVPGDLLRLATEADEQIVQYRDRFVTHEQSPRTIRATMWSKDSSPSIHVGRVHPRDTDPEGVRSASPGELMALIDEYVGTVLDWLAE